MRALSSFKVPKKIKQSFFPEIYQRRQHQDPQPCDALKIKEWQIAEAILLLGDEVQLTPEQIEKFKAHTGNLRLLALSIVTLSRHDRDSTQKHYTTFGSHQLLRDHFDDLVAHENPWDFAYALITLNKIGLKFDDYNAEEFHSYNSCYDLNNFICVRKKNEYLQLLVDSKNPRDIADGIKKLHREVAHLDLNLNRSVINLSRENFARHQFRNLLLFVTTKEPNCTWIMASIFAMLKKSNLLDEHTIRDIHHHREKEALFLLCGLLINGGGVLQRSHFQAMQEPGLTQLCEDLYKDGVNLVRPMNETPNRQHLVDNLFTAHHAFKAREEKKKEEKIAKLFAVLPANDVIEVSSSLAH